MRIETTRRGAEKSGASARPLHVALDATALMPHTAGIDTMLMELARALDRHGAPHRYTLFHNWGDAPRFAIEGGRVRMRPALPRPRAARLIWQQALLPAYARALRADIVHSPAFIGPLLGLGLARTLMIHDLTTLTLPECHTRMHGGKPFNAAMRLSANRADRIFTPSQVVADAVAAWAPQLAARVRVAPHGIGDAFYRAGATAPPRPRLGGLPVQAPYILFVGTLEPRKNLIALIRAFEIAIGLLESESTRPFHPHHLVIVGRDGWQYEPIHEAARQSPLAGRIHFTGAVDGPTLCAAMANAALFTWPSLDEGFGLPPIEAMAAGCPVLANDIAINREIAGDSAQLAAAHPEPFGRAIAAILSDPARAETLRRRARLHAAKYTWEIAAQKYVQLFSEALTESR